MKVTKFFQHCQTFKDKVNGVLQSSNVQSTYIYLIYFNLVRVLFTLAFIISRACYLLIENDEEINNRLLWASTSSLTASLAYMIYFRSSFTFDEFLLYFTLVSMI